MREKERGTDRHIHGTDRESARERGWEAIYTLEDLIIRLRTKPTP